MKTIGIAFLVCFSACSTNVESPTGSVIFDESFEHNSGVEKTHQMEVTLNDKELPAVIDVELTSRQSPMDGLAIEKIRAKVKSSNGWTASKSQRGNPINEGTHEKPVMAVPMIVSLHRTDGCTKKTRQIQIVFSADGTFELR